MNAQSAGGRWWSVRRVAVATGAFVAGFAAACAAIGGLLPFPDIPVVRAKLDYLAAHGDEFDTLFIGSSRMQFQVLPEIFDDATARAGFATHSFNAGVAGMFPPEDGFMLDQILRHPPKHLRWVFIELGRIRCTLDPRAAATERAVYWHDAQRTALMCRSILDYKHPKRPTIANTIAALQEPLADTLSHVALFCRRGINLGRGAALVEKFSQVPDWPVNNEWSLGARRDGWVRADRPEHMNAAELADFTERVAENRARPARPNPGDAACAAALTRMVKAVEKVGARVVLVAPPVAAHSYFAPPPEIEKSCPVLNFMDLDKYGELFAPEMRFDTGHVNTEGSKLYTRALVRRFIESVTTQP